MESNPTTSSTENHRDLISSLKEAAQRATSQQINKRSKLLDQYSKELKGIMRDQLVLKKFCKTTSTWRIWESSFREMVNNPIVLSVDVGEQQILKAKN